MSDQLEHQLEQAAPTPAGPVDADTLWRRGRRRRRGRHVGALAGVLLVVGAAGALATQMAQQPGRVEFAGPGPRVSAVQEAADDGASGGVVAEQHFNNGRARARLDGDEVCVEIDFSYTDTVGRRCVPRQALRGLLAVHGRVATKAAAPRMTVFAALVPDGYTEYRSDHHRGNGPVEDNLMVIVGVGRELHQTLLPQHVELHGPAGQRRIPVTAEPTEQLVLDHRGRRPLRAEDLTAGMTPGVVAGERLRVFATRPDGEDQAFALVADAQHLDGEGLWWCPDEEVFVGPTHGELFDPAGQLVAGPARADLDRLPLEATEEGLLVADVDQREPGTPRDAPGFGLEADINPEAYERSQGDWQGPPQFCADHQPPIERPDTHL